MADLTRAPAEWLLRHADHLPTAGAALDVACGEGRHAVWLAGRGLRVTAVDREERALMSLQREARAVGIPATYRGHLAQVPRPEGPGADGPGVEAVCVDLEAGGEVLPADAFDVVVVANYLHRPLVRQLLTALRPGGVLVYETFTTAQAQRGRPTNPDFLLRPRELRDLVATLEVLAWREGAFDGRDVASIVARRPR